MADYLSTNRIPANKPIGGAHMASTEAVPRDKSNTEQAINDLEGVSSRLDALVSEVERRFAPVLLSAKPLGDKGECRPTASPLADKMFNEASRLRDIADRLDSIISRVDL